MKDLIDRLLRDDLSPEELRELRQRIKDTSDETLSQYIGVDDNANIPDDTAAEAGSIARIKQHLDTRITAEGATRRFVAMPRWMTVATSIALPVMILMIAAMIAFGGRGKEAATAFNTVATRGHNDAEVSLSDGTIVRLCSHSALQYPAIFGATGREVAFQGTAFFDVARLDSIPFRITAPGIEILVKGTRFGVTARDNDQFAQLTLYEGIVDLTSTVSQRTVTLTSGEMATLDNRNGEITVSRINRKISLDWDKNEIRIQNLPPDSLISLLESHYGIAFPATVKRSLNSNFTGTLPFDDLHVTMKVLSRIYGFAPDDRYSAADSCAVHTTD